MFLCGQRPQQDIEYLYQIICTPTTKIVREEDEYSGIITETSWNISYLKETNQLSPTTIKNSFELDKDKNYYLVTVIWSDNNDWETHTRGSISFIQLFEDEHKAQDLCQTILKQYLIGQDSKNTHNREFTLQFKNENNCMITIQTPWNGYFKYLEQCFVQKIELNPELSNKYKQRL